MKKRRITAVLLSLLMTLTFVSGCGGGGKGDKDKGKGKDPISVTLSFVGEVDGALTYEYSGSKKSVDVNTGEHNVSYKISYSDENGAPLSAQPVNAGSYKVKAYITEDGYVGERQIPFVITKKPLTLSASPITVEYGEAYTAQCSIAQKVDATIVTTYVGQTQKPQLPGVYEIAFDVSSENYSGHTSAVLTINGRTSGFSFSGLSAVYDGNPHAATIVSSSLDGYHSVVGVSYKDSEGEVSQNAPINAGTYEVTFTLAINNPVGNLLITTTKVKTTLVIAKRSLQLVAQDKWFDLTEDAEHDIDAEGLGLTTEWLLERLDVSYTQKGVEDAVPTSEKPLAEGTYIVTFVFSDDNYTAEPITAEYTFAVDPLYLTPLNQTYGNKTTIQVRPVGFTIKEISFEGIDVEYAPSSVQPDNVGRYKVTALIERVSGQESVIESTLVISRRQVQFTAQDQEIMCGEAITHDLSVVLPDHTVTYYSGEGSIDGATPLSGVPVLAGKYTVVITITDPNYIGSAQAVYTFKARLGRLTLKPADNTLAENEGTIAAVFSGNPVAVVADGLGAYHTERNLTYTGTGSTVYNSATAPKNVGTYKATYTCKTDGVTETISVLITISKLRIVLEDLPDMEYEKGETYGEGTPYQIPEIALPAGETLTFLFDGLERGQAPYLPGLYDYTVECSANISSSITDGQVKILLTDTMTAYEYGEYYFNNAPDYRALSAGMVVANPSMGIEETVTYNFTERFKTSNADSQYSFASFTGNAGGGTTGTGATDARMALQTYCDGETWDWKGAFTTNIAPGMKPAQWDAWNAASDRTDMSAPYGINLSKATTGSQGTVPKMSGSGSVEELDSAWKINYTELNNYNITSDNITTGKGALELNGSGQYKFTFTFTSAAPNNSASTGVHNQHCRDQLRRFASGTNATYKSFTSLDIEFTLDACGRIIRVAYADVYVMETKVSLITATAKTTVSAVETFEYDTDYKIIMDAEGNPVARQAQSADFIASAAPLYDIEGTAKTATINVMGGSGNYSYEIISTSHDGVTLTLPEGSNELTIARSVNTKAGIVKVKVTDNVSGAETTCDIYYTTGPRDSQSVSACLAEGTLITLSDGSKKAIEQLEGDEMLLVWNHATGSFDVASIAFIESHDAAEYQIVQLCFEDGSDVKIIYQHAFWDADLNRYVYIDAQNCAEFIGHYFNKQVADGDGNLIWTNVKLVDAKVYTQYTRSYNIITNGAFNLYANDMLSVSALTEWLTNIFEIDADTMQYNQESLIADINKYGLFTYEEFIEILPVSQELFEAFNGEYLKISIGKGLIDAQGIVDIFGQFAHCMLV